MEQPYYYSYLSLNGSVKKKKKNEQKNCLNASQTRLLGIYLDGRQWVSRVQLRRRRDGIIIIIVNRCRWLLFVRRHFFFFLNFDRISGNQSDTGDVYHHPGKALEFLGETYNYSISSRTFARIVKSNFR